jgi:hypothetical protein
MISGYLQGISLLKSSRYVPDAFQKKIMQIRENVKPIRKEDTKTER